MDARVATAREEKQQSIDPALLLKFLTIYRDKKESESGAAATVGHGYSRLKQKENMTEHLRLCEQWESNFRLYTDIELPTHCIDLGELAHSVPPHAPLVQAAQWVGTFLGYPSQVQTMFKDTLTAVRLFILRKAQENQKLKPIFDNAIQTTLANFERFKALKAEEDKIDIKDPTYVESRARSKQAGIQAFQRQLIYLGHYEGLENTDLSTLLPRESYDFPPKTKLPYTFDPDRPFAMQQFFLEMFIERHVSGNIKGKNVISAFEKDTVDSSTTGDAILRQKQSGVSGGPLSPAAEALESKSSPANSRASTVDSALAGFVVPRLDTALDDAAPIAQTQQLSDSSRQMLAALAAGGSSSSQLASSAASSSSSSVSSSSASVIAGKREDADKTPHPPKGSAAASRTGLHQPPKGVTGSKATGPKSSAAEYESPGLK